MIITHFKTLLLSFELFFMTFSASVSNVIEQSVHRLICVDKQNTIAPDGKPFLIQDINLDNWLNPEDYIFLITKVNSFRFIDKALIFLNKNWFSLNYHTIIVSVIL
jgi:hypothetical protein